MTKTLTKVETFGFKRIGTETSEVELLKERMAKLLLGEDMLGFGEGVCPALAISNAITNLYAVILGQQWRLAPLHSEKKTMWIREIEVLSLLVITLSNWCLPFRTSSMEARLSNSYLDNIFK
ncbi:unnamed protein product [Eruca vesicaria subsp. sativa]|uniref:PRONE domain-containing protein n=1 Tax=Eruca vesicaria subsp. sativa TaxID=29727 RepID=A0ABC8KK21_ERUVS|nr:unnamed protein product [Eruca vesicaria subsp. sativa]